MKAEQGKVAAVSCNDTYAFTKPVRGEIFLVAGVGVKGDVHAGLHVKHRGRVRNDPSQPNFRQVHLIQRELFDEVGEKGYDVEAGNLGENVTTTGIDLLGLPRGTILRFGPPGGVAEASETETETETGAAEAAETAAGVLAGVLEVAAAAPKLTAANSRSAVAIAAAAARDRGDDPRAAIVVAGLRNPCAQINGFQEGLLKEVLGKDEQGNVVRRAGVMAVVLRGGPIRPGDLVTAELPPTPHERLEAI